MQVELDNFDLDVVETALVSHLKKCVASYEAGDKSYQNDCNIAGLQRSLEAIGRPYTTKYDKGLGKTLVVKSD